ncbi:MAG: hypothetical protein IKP40_02700 [Clostridia bacterium]|nr:hypothetical protein [Clostridia bacterium]
MALEHGVDGSVAYTDSVRLMAPAVSIYTQPQSYTASIGDQITLFVGADHVNTYLWQYSYDDGAFWSDFTSDGYNTATYTYTVEANHYMRLIRCKLTDLNGTAAYTDTVKLIAPDVSINVQPKDATALIGDKVTLSVEALNVRSYLWQYSNNEGMDWINFTSGGHNTASYTYTVESQHYIRLIRCKLTGLNGTILYTDSVKLLAPEIVISVQPKSYDADLGETVTLVRVTKGRFQPKSHDWLW